MPGTDASLITLLDDAVRTWGDRTFLESGDRCLTFREVRSEAARMATLLRERRVEPGDRILIARSDPVTAIVTVLGALSVGVVCTIADPEATRFAVDNVFSDLLPFAVLADGSTAYAAYPDLGAQARENSSPVGAALIMYTSGSTGRPKGIVASHRNVRFAAAAIQERLVLRPDDRVACLLPLTFDYGLYQVFLALTSGCAVVFGSPRKLGAGVLSFLTRNEITVLPSVSTLSRMILSLTERRGAAIPPLRMVTSTGESMSESLLRRIQATFPAAEVLPMFGLTECKRVSILLPSEIDERPTSVGRPLTGTRCEIVDENGDQLPPNEVGQLVVFGPHVTLGYWRDEELTDRVFRSVEGGARALFTGDRAWIDEDGYLFFAGRDDDVFKRRGFRISAAEIAFAAEQIEGVTAAVCIPPGSNRQQEVVLVVNGTASPDRVSIGLAELLAPHQLPDRIEAVDEIPLTRHGKADIRALSAMADLGIPEPR
jgi:acyl-coenzyme A synthetase/AMP-(fatty) acid ligase